MLARSVISAIAVFCAAECYALHVELKVIPVPTTFCGVPFPVPVTRATVYFPTGQNQKYPLLSFALGSGTMFPSIYNGTLASIAEMGYVIVALHGCVYGAREWKPQITTLEYLLHEETEFSSIIDKSAPTGIFGHSQGGAATICSSSDKDAVKRNKIAAAVAMHPGVYQMGEHWSDWCNYDTPKIPVLYTSGTLDTTVPPSIVKAEYWKTAPLSSRGFAVFTDYHHTALADYIPSLNPNGLGAANHEIEWIGAMMDCYVKHQRRQCDKIFGFASDALCNAGQTSECETIIVEDSTDLVV